MTRYADAFKEFKLSGGRMHIENKAEGVQWISSRNIVGQERLTKYI